MYLAKKIKAIFFDLDGVLVNAVQVHFEALNKALKLFGYVIEEEEQHGVYNGLPTKKKLRLLSERKGLPKEIHGIIGSMKAKYTIDLLKKACKPSYRKILMLKYLKKKGIELVCCSNAQRESVIRMLTASELLDYFEFVIGNDEGVRPKPAPDLYLEAYGRVNLKKDEVIIVEDADHGYKAAIDSGCPNVIKVDGYEDVDLSLFL